MRFSISNRQTCVHVGGSCVHGSAKPAYTLKSAAYLRSKSTCVQGCVYANVYAALARAGKPFQGYVRACMRAHVRDAARIGPALKAHGARCAL